MLRHRGRVGAQHCCAPCPQDLNPKLFGLENFGGCSCLGLLQNFKCAEKSSSDTSSTTSTKTPPTPRALQKTVATLSPQTRRSAARNECETLTSKTPASNAQSNTPPSNSYQSQSAETPTSCTPSPQSPSKTPPETKSKSLH